MLEYDKRIGRSTFERCGEFSQEEVAFTTERREQGIHEGVTAVFVPAFFVRV